MADKAVTLSGTGPDELVVLGSGILGHTPYERHTDRWGAVHLTVLDSVPGEPAPARTVPVPLDDDLAARILQNLAKANTRYADAAAAAGEAAARRPDNRIVGFDRAPLGTAGTLVARLIAADPFYARDDDPPELRAPQPGERVVLGTGTLFTEEYAGAPVIGVRPGDERAENWMDHYAIARCRHHLVRLEFEPRKDSAPATEAALVQAARQEGDLPQSVVRTAQDSFPVANPLAQLGQAASEPARPPDTAATVAAAKAPEDGGGKRANTPRWRTPGSSRNRPGHPGLRPRPAVALMSELNEAIPPEPGTTPAAGPAKLPVTVALGQLPQFERAAPDGTPATMRFCWPEQLLRGDVIEGLRDPWAVVAHVTRSGPDVTIRVQEAGGSRTTAYGTQQRGFGVRRDIRVDSSTIPDIPDGFPPRWGVWREEVASSRTLAWYPEPGKAAEHARQASRDGREYVVELEAPDGSWAQVDAYQQGRRSTWGKQLAAGLSKTVMPPWATPGNDETADRTAGQPASPAEQGKAPADRASAPGLAGTSFPTHVQAGLLAAPSSPAPSPAQQHSSGQAQGRRR